MKFLTVVMAMALLLGVASAENYCPWGSDVECQRQDPSYPVCSNGKCIALIRCGDGVSCPSGYDCAASWDGSRRCIEKRVRFCQQDSECDRDERCSYGRCEIYVAPPKDTYCPNGYDYECERQNASRPICSRGTCIESYSCREDRDCNGVNSKYLCIRSVCKEPAEVAEDNFCRENRDCAAGSRCNLERYECEVDPNYCNSTTRCPQGFECGANNTCQKISGWCERNSECGSCEECRSNSCQRISNCCRSSSDCSKGSECTNSTCSRIPGYCDNNYECGVGEECYSNQCRRLTGYCERNSDCDRSERCNMNRYVCERIPGWCDNDGHCNTGYRCNTTSNQCEKQEEEPTYECLYDRECGSGRRCDRGRCVADYYDSGSNDSSNDSGVKNDDRCQETVARCGDSHAAASSRGSCVTLSFNGRY